MCGICGAVALNGKLEMEPGVPQRMIGALRHRGPDEFGAWADDRVFLGHARLSIIDLKSGQQPMAALDGRLQLVFNGEIFNYIELRDQLVGLGHEFATTSDTEVILKAYRQWGAACVEHFNGQFAIVLYDLDAQRIFMARDRFGIRPLFHARCGDRLLFASEIKALGAWPDFSLSLDPDALTEIFNYWVNVPPATAFRNVQQLPPGHLAIHDLQTGDHKLHRYWHPQFLPAAEDHRFVDRDETRHMAKEVREALVDATLIRLRADVPVGAYLSGGLDSSATAALIRSETDNHLKTFSVGFQDADFDESKWQHLMSAKLGTDHESIAVGQEDIAGRFRDVIRHAETPILRTAPSPLFSLSGLVRRQQYKVVLTGEGADEVFCGYNIFREAKVRDFWSRQPESSRRPELLTRLYPYLQKSPASFLKQFYGMGLADRDAFFSHQPRWRNTSGTAAFFHEDIDRTAAPQAARGRMLDALPAEFAGWGPVARAQYLEMTTFMAGYLLSSQGDRMLMGNSVEGRFPFLDHNLAEVAAQLPASVKLASLKEKAILKAAVADLLPREIVDRPKQPYRAPDSASFLTGTGRDLADEALSDDQVTKHGLFDRKKVNILSRKWREGKLVGARDNMAFVGILSTQLLAELFGGEYRRSLEETRLEDPQLAWR
jgi:asparagine synthase (glutamine-hydrolysing)